MSEFTAENFRLRVLDRLSSSAHEPAGDHILNPDIADYGEKLDQVREAAVLIGIVDRGEDTSILLTRRTEHLRSHAGQIAFPGGKVDEEDEGPVGAALREAEEEVGLTAGQVEVVGDLGDYYTGSGYRIVPVLATVKPPLILSPNPAEVDEVFEVPLSFLMNPENHHKKSGEFRGKTRYYYAMPFEQRYIWGVTAGILRVLYNRVYA
ncbi:putative Nudix hydrolase NudL [Pseudovibrio axinellae]|uniref:Putative Nudix hydrolase NudL n=1 Tax=Pseudovibrio axinellae TaxID=989403 RepID=A0A165XTL9_9HYPH|nr:CoA pyrophosphatase [Pseudovibrio axinellae]KZL18026.1 putative Nudix hydrolase NudL [Pseudovibrio axinellae]SER13051.1 8-oxo-dGTP pyrophosphatase MutT, NUDIX family [Pseudovibrio axinellae]